MHFTCSRPVLNDALSILSSVVPPRSAKPVLQNILIRGNEDGTILLCATDLEIAVSYVIQVEEMKDQESILLPANRFAGLIRDEWSDTISFSSKEGHVELISTGGKYKLNGTPADEFPSMKQIEGDDYLEIPAASLQDAIAKTVFATSRSDSRYALNGVNVVLREKEAEFVSSDTHRLSLSKKKVRNPKKIETSAIVITKGMVELSKLARDEETVKLSLTTRELIAETSKASFVCRLVDGQFPRYQDVLPKNLSIKVTVNREDLLRVLRPVGHMTNEETHSITVISKENAIEVIAAGSEAGEAVNTIDAEIQGGAITAGFNYLYLQEALKVILDEKVTFQFENADTAVRIDCGDFTHVIMPIKPRG